MFVCTAYAAQESQAPLGPVTIERREPGPTDVAIDILFCGVCHSDLHQARNEWNNTMYPCVPGHEIVGRVTAVGELVSRFKIGDIAGVGCLVGSCGTCVDCAQGLEQYCSGTGLVPTYNGFDPDTGHTFGGYAQKIVVDQAFVLRIPEGLDPAGAAPLLCAGITTYSPLKHWNIGPGVKVGVAGLGGLGHMAVKIARAMGADVYVFTRSASKREDALRLGATDVVITGDESSMDAHADSFDFVLDTIAADHDLDAYLGLVKRDGTLCLVGAPENPQAVAPFSIIFRRRSLAGSLIGGIAETQEMLDFCAAHGITADIELIRMDEINTAFERMVQSDVKYRFVIDMATL